MSCRIGLERQKVDFRHNLSMFDKARSIKGMLPCEFLAIVGRFY
jgi:hypothetical protein